ncbi:MAG: PQQ-binding-like beta-propeller repeat protein [Thermoproteota archaeon]
MLTRLGAVFLLLLALTVFIPLALPKILSEPQGLADSPWPMFKHDPQHTGRSPYLGAQTNGTKWRYRTGFWIESSPAIGSDGTIYVGSFDGYLYAIGGKTFEGETPLPQQMFLTIAGATATLAILIIIVILKRRRKPLQQPTPT